MVANYRCNELKDEAIATVKPRIETLIAQSDNNIVEQFGETCSGIMREATEFYRNVAKQYNKDVFNKVLKELTENLMAQLYHCFDS